jgi:hypothetical protein
MVYSRPLAVYDNGGRPVPESVAKATGIAPRVVGSGTPQSILISAAVVPSLNVSLSSTQIAWEIKKTGTYQARAVDIAVGVDNFITEEKQGDLALCPRPLVTMVVSGAGNLSEMPVPTTESAVPIQRPRQLPTFYALTPTFAKGVPPDTNYVVAEKFNGGHALRSIYTSIWNKLVLDDSRDNLYPSPYPAGKYQDEFTVTFLQAL